MSNRDLDKENSTSSKIKILIIDDHPLFTTGISLLLKASAGYHCIHAGHLDQALKLIAEKKPDLILLDLNLNQQHWKKNILQINKANTDEVPLAIISSAEEKQIIREALNTNVQGFIPKSSSTDMLLAAINLLLVGGVFIPPQFTDKQAKESKVATEIKLRLSERQRQTLKQAIAGKPNKVIAQELNLSESTVKSHLSTAYRVLNVKNRTQAIQMCEDIFLFQDKKSKQKK